MKKYRRLFAVIALIAVLLSALSGCRTGSGDSKAGKPINPDLTLIFGEAWAEENAKTIANLASAMEECYTKHQKEKNVYQFIIDYENAIAPYEEFIQEVRDDLFAKYEAETDKEKNKIMTNLVLRFPTGPISAFIYKAQVELGDDSLVVSPEEAEQNVIETINVVFEFFYGEPLVETA